MLNDLIEKIAAQTGVPAESVQPVLGAVLAHLGEILPPPIAHQLAIMLGIHAEDGPPAAGAAPNAGGGGGLGGLLGGLLGGGGGAQGGFAGAGSLMTIAESMLGGMLSGKR